MSYVLCDNNGMYLAEHWQKTYENLSDAIRLAILEAIQRDKPVYVWDKTNSWNPDAKPFKVVFPDQIGTYHSIYVNQGMRSARCVAQEGSVLLLEYTMPKGTTGLKWYDLETDTLKSVGYNKVPKRIAAKADWDCNPQKHK